MGQDKAWLMLDGRPLVMRVIDRVLPLVDEVIVSTNQPDTFDVWLPSLTRAGLHRRRPLSWRRTSRRASRWVAGGALRSVLTLATDMPFVNPALIRYLAELAADADVDAVVPQIPSPETGQIGLEPLHAIYRRTCLPAIEGRL